MIRGAIFDLDGTLLDSMSLWDTLGADYLRSLGKEPVEDLAETFRAFTLEESAQYYRDHYGVTLSVEEILAGIDGMIQRYYLDTVPLKPGAEDFLGNLPQTGVKLAVATVTPKHLAEGALKRLGVLDLFEGVFACGHGDPGKEDPWIYRQALECLGTRKEETVVLEDVLHALSTAKEDGFLTAGVYDAHEERQQELRGLADCFIQTYSEAQDFWALADLKQK